MSDWTGNAPTEDQLRNILEQHARWVRGNGGSAANLSWANLSGANLSGAKDAERVILRQQIVPQTGSFQAWKRLRDDVVALIEVPAEAARVGGLRGRKCRAEYATTKALYKVGQREPLPRETVGYSRFEAGFTYRVGSVAKPDTWNPDPATECSGGIHFFLNREEAEEP